MNEEKINLRKIKGGKNKRKEEREEKRKKIQKNVIHLEGPVTTYLHHSGL